MGTKDEKYFIKKVKQGDGRAFTYFVEQYKNMVYTLALRMLKVEEDAEEAAQDAFLKAYCNIDGFKGDSKFSTWLYQIVFNTCISRLRKKKIALDPLDDRCPPEISSSEYKEIERILTEEEQKKLIRNALTELEPNDSFLLTLFYLEELDHKEIAKITGLTRNNIKVKIFRARRKLFDILKKNIGKEVYTLL